MVRASEDTLRGSSIMDLIRLKKILEAIKPHILSINCSFPDTDTLEVLYGTQYYGLKLRINVSNTNTQPFNCDVATLIKGLDCLISPKGTIVSFEDGLIKTETKKLEIVKSTFNSQVYVSPSYTETYRTEDIKKGFKFVVNGTSDSLPHLEYVNFQDGLVQALCGYSAHEYFLGGFNGEFALHRTSIYQLVDLLDVLEDYDIFNPSDRVLGGHWSNGYAFKAADSYCSFEIISIKAIPKINKFNLNMVGSFKINRYDLYDICTQAQKAKSTEIHFSGSDGLLEYYFRSKTRTLALQGQVRVLGLPPSFIVDTNLLHKCIASGRVVEVLYGDPGKPFQFQIDGTYKSFISPLK